MNREKSVNLSLDKRASYQEVCNLMEQEAGKEVKCLQQTGEKTWVVTLKSDQASESLKKKSLRIGENAIHTAGAGRPITFVTLLYAPCEMGDQPITTALSPYGKVINVRRGHWQQHPLWENGNRHVKMEMDRPIPSYLQVGPYRLVVKYNGQVETCRRCGGPGHKAADCPNFKCHNCGEAGHRAAECPSPPICRACHQEGHISTQCPTSFANRTRGHPRLSESSDDEEEMITDRKATMTFPPPPTTKSTTETEQPKPRKKKIAKRGRGNPTEENDSKPEVKPKERKPNNPTPDIDAQLAEDMAARLFDSEVSEMSIVSNTSTKKNSSSPQSSSLDESLPSQGYTEVKRRNKKQHKKGQNMNNEQSA